jgi:hypothetical protein
MTFASRLIGWRTRATDQLGPQEGDQRFRAAEASSASRWQNSFDSGRVT